MFIFKLCFSLQEYKAIDIKQDVFQELDMPMPFIFNNSKFEQILQIHAVSKKSLCLTKTKVKILDPGNIQQNKLQIQSETNQTLTMQRRQLPTFIYLKRTNFFCQKYYPNTP